MSAESLWDPDMSKTLMESTHIPEDVFSLLDGVAPVEKIAPIDENQSKNSGKHVVTDDSLPGPSKKCRLVYSLPLLLDNLPPPLYSTTMLCL